MKQRSYRRLTRGLFLLLFLFFLLLYLLIASDQDAGPTGGGWGNRVRDMGVIELSAIRSGGFILDQLPIPDATALDAEDFNENVIACVAILHNQDTQAIQVNMGVYGTNQAPDQSVNPGLNCGVYYYSGADDPVAQDYGTFFAQATQRQANMGLYTDGRYPAQFQLQPDERRTLVLCLWTDEGDVPTLTDLVRDAYSVTTKLTARAL